MSYYYMSKKDKKKEKKSANASAGVKATANKTADVTPATAADAAANVVAVDSVNAATAERMHSLAEKYPWFDGAVIASAGGDMGALPIHILLRMASRPSLVLHGEPTAHGVSDNGQATAEPSTGEPQLSTIDIIDCFMENGEHKVVATDNTPEFISDIVHGPGLTDSDELDDELITEDLAEVYMNQELFDQAKSIYGRLSLLYPKKSVYFAEIIEKIESRKNPAANNNK